MRNWTLKLIKVLAGQRLIEMVIAEFLYEAIEAISASRKDVDLAMSVAAISTGHSGRLMGSGSDVSLNLSQCLTVLRKAI